MSFCDMMKPDALSAIGCKIPEGKTHFDSWGVFEIGECRALILGDIHAPYQERKAVVATVEAGRESEVDTVILNGDTVDFYAISKWQTDPKKRNLVEEIKTARELIKAVRAAFPKARIVFKVGNHDDRWGNYIMQSAPQLSGLEEFELEAVLQLEKFGVEFVADKRVIGLGDLSVIHGHEYRGGGGKNPAKWLFDRALDYALCNHFHRSTHYSDKTIRQKNVATWSIGCLCEMHPDYAPYNGWHHGFAIVEVGGNGKFSVRQRVISGGKVY